MRPILKSIFLALIYLIICIAMVEAQTVNKEKPVGKDPLPGPGVSELMGRPDSFPPESERQGHFLLALGNDDLKEAAWLLKQGVSVNQPFDKSGQTALMLAQSLKMAELLFTHGAKIGIRDADGGTVLHYAVTQKAALELIPFFISHGADINARGWEDETPLFVAISYFNEMGPSQTEPVFTGQTNASSVPSPSDKSVAQQVIELMAKSGADLNASDAYGYTPLMQCTAADNTKLVELLLELGADKNIRNKDGRRAIDIAYDLGRRYIYQLLE